MGKIKNITGEKFGMLTAISMTGFNKYNSMQWLCKCDCGNEKIIDGHYLRNGQTVSCGCKNPNRYINLIGIKFNRLLVLEQIKNFDYSKKNVRYWKCLCDCGKETIVITNNLIKNKVKSCGCLHKDKMKERKGIENRKSRKGIASVENKYLCYYKTSLVSKKLGFEISDELAIKLFHIPCFYCGKFDIRKNTYTNEEYFLNGIDRINSKLGYVEENVVPCCTKCNMSKKGMDLHEFFMWIDEVYNYCVKDYIYNNMKEEVSFDYIK